MTSHAYHDILASCGKIDGRKTNYRFDLNTEICWDRFEESGLLVGPTLLRMLGLDLSNLHSEAVEVFQWSFAMSTCDAFYDLEDMVIRFTQQEKQILGPTRSVELLCEEELKHMRLFERYRQCLRSRRPDLADRWLKIAKAKHALPGSPEDRDTYPDVSSYHYMFWINTLFFEEFTIFFHQCLCADLGLIQPTWASVHDCHRREEIQHLPTDVAYLNSLKLSDKQRTTLSKAFLFRLENGFDDFFGLKPTCTLVQQLYPECRNITTKSLRETPLFEEILFAKSFRRLRDQAPYFSELARAGPEREEGRNGKNAVLVGELLAEPRDQELLGILKRAATEQPNVTVSYLGEDAHEARETYSELLQRAARLAATLKLYGPGSGIALLVLEKPYDFVGAFWACQTAGFVPVPVAAPPARCGLAADKRIRELHRALGSPLVLTSEALANPAPSGWRLLSINELAASESCTRGAAVGNSEVALLQFSSGSTGQPRGVVLTHRNVLASVAGIIKHLKATATDRMVSWMPLHHDMGLCLHLASVFTGSHQLLMTPSQFGRRPRLWLEKLHEHKATITASPNFGLALCARKAAGIKVGEVDLSTVRCILNGAEPISAGCVETFASALRPFGLRSDVILPCYGLAEATTAVTIAEPGEGLKTKAFDRMSLSEGRGVIEVPADDPAAVRLVDVGVAVPGTELRIANEDGTSASPGMVGEIEISGPNVTAGYWNDLVGSSKLRTVRWTRTGDLGVIFGGRLFVVGRRKDVILINGRQFFAHDVEEAVRDIEGVNRERIAVVGRRDPVTGSEQVIAFLHRRMEPARTHAQVAKDVSTKIAELLQHPVHRILFLRSDQFPLTTSGKIQRYLLREAYERGEFDHDVGVEQAVEPVEESARVEPITGSNGDGTCKAIDLLREVWADVLNQPVSSIDIDRSFFELGGDSLRAIEIHSCLEERWGAFLDQRILFECRTVREQARILMGLSAPRQDSDGRAPAATRPEVSDRDIAVIAMAGRFPAADNLEEFWKLLRDGRSAFREPPPDRWNANSYYDPDVTTPGKTVCRVAAFLNGIQEFDARACRLSEEEARQMDPQQRLFLEIVCDLLDQAHLNSKKVGVFAGAAENEYFSRQAEVSARINRLSAQTNLANMLAARVAQVNGFTGPALTLDAACATSLVAVHYACSSLYSGECDLAIAGGVQLNLSAVPQLMFSQAGVLSPRGCCQPYAKDADGFVPGEGAGAILLKPLATAIRDADPILGIIRGSAINNDGGAMSGMAPNPAGQVEVIQNALAAANIAPCDVTYIEGHGAGTRIGDLVEVRALEKAFTGSTLCSIGLGSAKSNVGHLFHAAGICSVIKLLLAFRHEELPPTAGSQQLNPQIQFERTPFFAVQSVVPWPRLPQRRRLAGISAFGVGGTNCHVIIEEPPEHRVEAEARDAHLLCLSAPGPEELVCVQNALADALEADTALTAADFCATANQRALRFDHRCSLPVPARREAIERLRANPKGIDAVRAPPLVFLFAGPGGHYAGMGRHLRHEPVFNEMLNACDAYLRPLLGFSLDELFADRIPELDRIENAQPASFVYGYATARWLESIGVVPDAVLGHSGGEYVAGCIAGVLTLEEAIHLSYARGIAMRDCEPGSMAAVFASHARVRTVLTSLPDVDIACVNSPNQTVISGRRAAIAAALGQLRKQGLPTEILKVACAAHSSLMRRAQSAFSSELKSIAAKSPNMHFFSTVTGRQEKSLGKAYWLEHLTAPVLFEAAVGAAVDAGYRDFVDVGPSAALSQLVKEITVHSKEVAQAARCDKIHLFPVIRRSFPGWQATLTTIGQLFERGVPIATQHLDGRFRSGKAVLPAYPYTRKRLWLEQPETERNQQPHDAAECQTRCDVSRQLDLRSSPFICDHRVHGECTAPSALLIDLVLNVLVPAHESQMLEDVLVERPLALTADQARVARVRRERTDGSLRVCLESSDVASDLWTTHLSACIGARPKAPEEGLDLASILARCPIEVLPVSLNERLALAGMEYGPTLNTIAQLWVGAREVVARLQLCPEQIDYANHHVLHPGLADGAIRSVGALRATMAGSAGAAFLGFAIRRVAIFRAVTADCLAYVRLSPDCVIDRNTEVIRYDLTLVDAKGRILATLDEVCLKKHDVRTQAGKVLKDPAPPSCARLYAINWTPVAGLYNAAGRDSNVDSVIVGAPTPLRIGLEQRFHAAGARAVALQPPSSDGPWDHILRQIATGSSSENMRIILITSALDELASLVAGLEKIGVGSLNGLFVVSADAAIMSFVRTLALEQPDWGCRGIQADAEDLDAAIVYAEIGTDCADLIVSHRDGRRYLPILTPIRPSLVPHPLRKDGVYWITGGAGVLGSAVAEELARIAGARLLLTGRSPRADQQVLDRIKAAGGEALYISCDAADWQAMARAHGHVRQCWGRIHGAVHAAGVIDDGLIRNRDRARSDTAMKAKSQGARVLAEVTKDDELDFLIFFSSLVALTGMPGQADYAAANAAMDCLAHKLHQQGRRAKSLNWGPWAAGMAAQARYQRIYHGKGLRPLAAATGVQAFLQALSCDAVQIGIVDFEESREAELVAGFNRCRTLSRFSPSPNLRNQSSTSNLTATLTDIIAGHLHCRPEDIRWSTAFKDLGIDSLMAVEIALEIQKKLGVRVYPTLLLELRTIADLTNHFMAVSKRNPAP